MTQHQKNLRPGEKLYEELLIGNEPITTINSNIFLEKEEQVDLKLMNNIISNLHEFILTNNEQGIIEIFEKYIPDFKFNRIN